MPIPVTFNPMGIHSGDECFELTVNPTASSLTYGFSPYWNAGGYCSVDWGDGNSEEAVTSGTSLNHTYSAAGTYTVRINAECYRVRFSTTGAGLVTGCSENLDLLGNLTSGYWMFINCANAPFSFTHLPAGLTDGTFMFRSCSKARLNLTSLPEGLLKGGGMFQWCSNSLITLTSLPASLQSGSEMFSGCSKAEIDLDILAANAPAEGWTSLKNITKMFNGCSKVTGSRSAFLAKCPSDVTGADTAFTGTGTTE